MKNNKKITSLYEQYKNSPKKLKIVCDWDEVIQAAEPYASFKTIEDKKEIELEFDFYFEWFWETKDIVKYFPYGSVLNPTMFLNYPLKKQQKIKNSPDFYQTAPFLTIAEDLLKLIKEDKIEKLIFLVYCEVLDVKGKMEEKVIRDERIELVFKETFGKFPNCSLRKINYVKEKGGSGVEIQWSKADWIKRNASDFDIVIDDNPNICKSVSEIADEENADWDRHGDECMGCSDCQVAETIEIKVIAPYYPAIENQHDKRVLLVKNKTRIDFKKSQFILTAE